MRELLTQLGISWEMLDLMMRIDVALLVGVLAGRWMEISNRHEAKRIRHYYEMLRYE